MALDWLVHLGALIFLIAYIVRDQILLRALIVIGTLLYVIYYLLLDEVLIAALSWNVAFIIINIVMIARIYAERRVTDMSDEDMRLFRVFNTLNPGEFRRLLAIAETVDTARDLQITTEGEVPNKLYFVLDGQAVVSRSGRDFRIGPEIFIGELSYLMQKPATATVHVRQGANCLCWQKSSLNKLFSTNPQMKIAFDALLNRDLAQKLAKN